MTMPIKFDTLEYARKLAESGIPQAQATAQAQALSEALAESTVTPGELLLLRTDVVARIEIVKIGQDSIRNGLDSLRQGFDNLKNGQDSLRQAFENLKRELDNLKSDLEAFTASVKKKFTVLFWMAGISMALHAVTIAMLVKIVDRLP